MVSQRLKKHASDTVYLQKARPCIRNHLITKADRSLENCLCECADNILRGNAPLTKLQKEKLKRNKALTNKSVSLKKKKAILQIHQSDEKNTEISQTTTESLPY
jgi:hypothetical protein